MMINLSINVCYLVSENLILFIVTKKNLCLMCENIVIIKGEEEKWEKNLINSKQNKTKKTTTKKISNPFLFIVFSFCSKTIYSFENY